MGEYTWRLSPVSPYDIGCFESWLSEQSAKGLFFAAAEKRRLGRLGFIQFRKGTPECRRYRIEPKRESSDWPPEEERRLYEEMGWRFAGSVENLFWVFEADDREDIPELHTDPAALGELYERVLLLPNAWVTVGMAVIYALLVLWVTVWIPSNPVKEFLTGNTLYQAALFLYIFLQYLVMIRHRVLPLRRLKRQLAQGIDIDHHAPYKRAARAFTLQNAAVLLLGVLIISSEIYAIKSHRVEVYSEADSLPSPALSTLEGGDFSYDEVQWHAGYPFGQRVEYNWSLLTPEQCIVTQEGTARGMRCRLLVEDYRVCVPWLAKPLSDSLLKEYTEDAYYLHEGLSIRRLNAEECAGFDEAVLVEVGEYGSQRMIARRGREVIEVSYTGWHSLLEVVPQLFAALDS